MTTDRQFPTLQEPATAPQPIITKPFLQVCVADFCAMVSFYLLLSVVPTYAASSQQGGLGAGLTTGVMMLSAVAAEVVSPRLAAAFGYRRVMVGGLLLLGAPAMALIASVSMPVLLAVSVVRGVGFAFIVVATAGLVASLAPPERRGEGLGLLGIAATLPAVIALPLGVLLVGVWGYPAVFTLGAGMALVGAAVACGLPSGGVTREETPLALTAAFADPSLARPAVIFAVTAMAGGILVTFLPAAAAGRSSSVISAALLLHSAASTVARWWTGRLADRFGAHRFVAPGVVVSAVGALAMAFAATSATVIAGAVIFGAGFGVAQSATLNAMFDHVPASGYGTVSALWNLAYDVGFGVGTIGFGVLVSQTGFPVAFGLTALLVVTVLPLTRTHCAETTTR